MDNNQLRFYHDDGTEVNPDLVPKPDLCISSKKEGLNANEDILCTLNRMDQLGEPEFKCGAYEPKKE